MKIIPLDDRVVIEVLEAESKTAGGIVLPDMAKEKPQSGKVVAVGQGHMLEDGRRVACSVKVGDIVLFGRYAGNEVRVGEVEFTIMKESDILAKEEGGTAEKKSKK